MNKKSGSVSFTYKCGNEKEEETKGKKRMEEIEQGGTDCECRSWCPL